MICKPRAGSSQERVSSTSVQPSRIELSFLNMVAKLFNVFVLPGVLSYARGMRHESKQASNFTGAASMIVGGISSREEYCLSIASGDDVVIVVCDMCAQSFG